MILTIKEILDLCINLINRIQDRQIVSEIQRIQSLTLTLQKEYLSLESENLDLKKKISKLEMENLEQLKRHSVEKSELEKTIKKLESDDMNFPFGDVEPV